MLKKKLMSPQAQMYGKRKRIFLIIVYVIHAYIIFF